MPVLTRLTLDYLAPKQALRRDRLAEGETPRVTNMELFFDLVYVFSIIQLSHYLLDNIMVLGCLEDLVLYAAVWWQWNHTAWVTNWVDPDHACGSLLMVVLMACALVMAVAMRDAWAARAGLFAGAYVTMHLLRAVYTALLFRGEKMGQNYVQLTVWSVIASALWAGGALAPGMRHWLWVAATAVDYLGPPTLYWLPGWGQAPLESWLLKGLHLMERNEQVVIIALGESILLLGDLLVDIELTTSVVLASSMGFLAIVTLWWIYFRQTAELGESRLELEVEARHTELARAGMVYANGAMVCGAIVVAVSIELVVGHPDHAVDLHTTVVLVAGPAIFLLGSAMFSWIMASHLAVSNVVGVLLIAGWALTCYFLRLWAMVCGAGVLFVLLGVAVVPTGAHKKLRHSEGAGEYQRIPS